MYSDSRSIPMASTPSRAAAISVVPLPKNGSSTVPPGGVTSLMSQRIRLTGFCVGWAVLRTGVPQPSHLLGADHSGDVASTTTPIKRPSLSGHIEVPRSEWKETPANLTGLVPFSGDELASTVQPLVFCRSDELDIPDAVVLLVAVDVVEVVPFGDRAELPFPDFDVLQDEPPTVEPSQIPGSGDVVSVGASWLRSSLTHEHSLTVSQLHVKC